MDSMSVNPDGTRMVKIYDEAYPTNVLEISRDNMSAGNSDHPTQKPVALFEYLIKTYTSEGDTVLDNCIGSGTTAVACKELNRHFIGIDISSEYCKIADGRLAQGVLEAT